MSSQAEKIPQSILMNECFDQVSKIPFVRNTWITAQAWLDFIRKEVTNSILTDIEL